MHLEVVNGECTRRRLADFPAELNLGRGPIRTSRVAPQSVPQRDQKPFDSSKHPSLGGDHRDGRDRLIAREGQCIALERVFSNRMMAPLIVDHPYRCVPDPLCEAQAYGLRSHRYSLSPRMSKFRRRDSRSGLSVSTSSNSR